MPPVNTTTALRFGAYSSAGERLHGGMQEVSAFDPA